MSENKTMENEFDAKGVIIDMLDNSSLNQQQINDTIKELIEYYNLENFILNQLTK